MNKTKLTAIIGLCALLSCAHTDLRADVQNKDNTQQVEHKDKAALKRAQYVTALAKKELKLNDEQNDFLFEAFYTRYATGNERTKGVTDAVKIDEIKKKIHKEFSDKLYKHFGKEKCAEIVAWYYNYSNKNNKPQ